ncbi:glycerol-3-phosphate dehydrogenase [Moelleriella libera RCEF 2490]|uniref:Glycerol-3-phosphate dehydrogenase n=1 Tax=Moelleriella libera RCEF 2490 TaxID=1081109 RepID=A0A166VAU4_9HYPO|nr:glycerol-3-phosphate dehydrogenase [Moelleriella libera RCEF 2490]
MASRLARLWRPAAAATVVAAGGTIAYSRANKNLTHEKALVPVQRDSSGHVKTPSFPAVKSRVEQLTDLRRHNGEKGDDTEYDLLIIGGGATGTGIALDAVTRGLKVALVERDDFSAGTSSKSTKLVHGGVRYLEKAVWNLDYPQLELVIEALRERRGFLNIAPHLSVSLPILLPFNSWFQAPYMWAGCKMYDLLAGSQGLESSYLVSRNKAIEAFPLLKRDNLVGALVYYDGQHNDSRMNVSLALTAALYGATVLNHVEVTSLEKDARGKIVGAQVRDVLGADGSPFTVRAKGVVNATGPFTDAIERMDDPQRKEIVAPASGAHIMLPGKLCPKGMGLLDAATSDGRVVFVLPWQGMTVAGTTDNACEVESEPIARQDDVDFILKEVSKLLEPGSVLTRDDVLATWSGKLRTVSHPYFRCDKFTNCEPSPPTGIRPLVRDPKAGNTESLVRSHLVTVSQSGLLTCAGGKWTTYRQMAQDAVDEAIRTFHLTPKAVALADISGYDLPGSITNGACKTLTTPVVGSHGFSTSLPSQLTEVYPGLDLDVAHHLATNYGDRAWAVLAIPNATARLAPSFPFIEAELRHAVRSEAACTAADVISRRTRLAFLDVDSALHALPRVIDVLAEELSWSDARKDQEWSKTVRFMRSMGLDEDKVAVTRDQVLNGQARARRSVPRADRADVKLPPVGRDMDRAPLPNAA